jgi:hypothetical protein
VPVPTPSWAPPSDGAAGVPGVACGVVKVGVAPRADPVVE